MLDKDEILEYIETASVKRVKQLAMSITAMLDDKQLLVLNKRFKKKIEFEPVVMKPKRTVKRTRKDDNDEEETEQDEKQDRLKKLDKDRDNEDNDVPEFPTKNSDMDILDDLDFD